MIYLKKYDDGIEKESEELLYCWGDVWRSLFSPCAREVCLIEFKLHGKTYAERREDLRAKAVDFSNNCNGGLYWGDEQSVITWFEKFGKRYGLIKEFRENGII